MSPIAGNVQRGGLFEFTSVASDGGGHRETSMALRWRRDSLAGPATQRSAVAAPAAAIAVVDEPDLVDRARVRNAAAGARSAGSGRD